MFSRYIAINIKPTTPQQNSSDCGVYAAAYITQLAFANNLVCNEIYFMCTCDYVGYFSIYLRKICTYVMIMT